MIMPIASPVTASRKSTARTGMPTLKPRMMIASVCVPTASAM